MKIVDILQDHPLRIFISVLVLTLIALLFFSHSQANKAQENNDKSGAKWSLIEIISGGLLLLIITVAVFYFCFKNSCTPTF